MKNTTIAYSEGEGTNVRNFLAHKGSIVVKEFREIGKLKGRYSDSIMISTLILAIIKGANRKTSYGVKLEHVGTESYSDLSVLLDFDELHELAEAFDFISSLAEKLKIQKCDYTEVVYSTKDDAQFGFYQDKDQQQQAFIKINSHDEIMFIDLPYLEKFKFILLNAQQHLIDRGADKE